MVSLGMTALVVVAACGGTGNADLALSAQAEEGRRLYNSSGCSGCHGGQGGGGVGPALAGLPGIERELIDGTTVIADEAYLVRSIMEPDAEIVAGYPLRMPSNRLTESQVADIVAYINEMEPSP
jgi:cytochrome c oxidase subunit 2